MKNRQMTNDFFSLFVRREWKVILGRNYSTLWLLVIMLSATFTAISFSNASMKYLSDKMNDPFIKWVDIKNNYGEGDFEKLENALSDSDNQLKYDYSGYQADYYTSFMFYGSNGKSLEYFHGRFFDNIKSELVEAILDEDNVVDNARIADLSSLSDETAGVVITQKALSKMGYTTAPAYLDLMVYSEGADPLIFELSQEGMAHAPIPVLAVVKRLPSSVDFISTKFLFCQYNNNLTYPFHFGRNFSYSESLRYFVPKSVDWSSFVTALQDAAVQYSTVNAVVDDYAFYKPEILPFVRGGFVSLVGEDEQPLIPTEVAAINSAIMEQWKQEGVFRVFDYNFYPDEQNVKSYLSVSFNKLTHVREFEEFVGTFKVKMDMSQINAKENFNAVSIMANVLSWSMIIFAVICIILFIVNLLKSYFQKVKRNIGTFKAFGVSNRRLTSIYILIVGATLAAAVVISLVITMIFQEGTILAGLLREGTYAYLSLWSLKTIVAILVVLLSSVLTVKIVIDKLVCQTPGDLIYDRN